MNMSRTPEYFVALIIPNDVGGFRIANAVVPSPFNGSELLRDIIEKLSTECYEEYTILSISRI